MADCMVFNASKYTDMPIKAKSIISQWSTNSSNRFEDGTKFEMDTDGRIVQAEYANGAKVRRHEDYCLVLSIKLEYWYGDDQGRWYQLD